jgi:hypothetical protein
MFFIVNYAHINPLNAELNPNCHLLALLGAHLIFHVSRTRVKDNNDGVFRRSCKVLMKIMVAVVLVMIMMMIVLYKPSCKHFKRNIIIY